MATSRGLSDSHSMMTAVISNQDWNEIDNPVIMFRTEFVYGDQLALADAAVSDGNVGQAKEHGVCRQPVARVDRTSTRLPVGNPDKRVTITGCNFRDQATVDLVAQSSGS